MVFKESRNLKNFISKLLFGIYFFALFSQNFHHHSSEEVFKNFSFQKSENTIDKNIGKEKAGDCLTCHFMATGYTLVPEELNFASASYTYEVKHIIKVQEKVWSRTKFIF